MQIIRIYIVAIPGLLMYHHAMLELILYSLIAGLFSLVGGLLILWRADIAKKYSTILLAFAAGSFLGVSFLDLLPEAVEAVDEPHHLFMAALGGFFIFFALETVFAKRPHSHAHPHAHGESGHMRSFPVLVILGDSLHNFLDGIVIALAFIANPLLGLPTAFAIAAHEIPQEIGDFAVLLDQGWSKMRVLAVNIISSLLSIIGVLVGYFAASLLAGWIPYLLAGASGIFFYLAASDLIPEIHHRARAVKAGGIIASFVIGLSVVGYLVTLTH